MLKRNFFFVFFFLLLIMALAGGAASKNSTLRVGDQIISVNDCDVRSMSRIEAWNLMKKLPDGAVSLIIRQQITSS
jgi:C-terminal processing protease CtpA/Prc